MSKKHGNRKHSNRKAAGAVVSATAGALVAERFRTRSRASGGLEPELELELELDQVLAAIDAWSTHDDVNELMDQLTDRLDWRLVDVGHVKAAMQLVLKGMQRADAAELLAIAARERGFLARSLVAQAEEARLSDAERVARDQEAERRLAGIENEQQQTAVREDLATWIAVGARLRTSDPERYRRILELSKAFASNHDDGDQVVTQLAAIACRA